MIDEDLDLTTPSAALPAAAARSAGLGFLVLLGILGVVVWRKYRR